MVSQLSLPEAFTSMAEALLVGILIGAQRETVKEGHRAGIRDFIGIALAGGICGLVQHNVLTAAVAAGIAGILLLALLKSGELRGITTEIAGLVTFCLAYLLAVPQYRGSAPLAIAITIVLVFALEAKTAIHRFVRETITPAQFNDTLRFVAAVLVIYPILPAGPFGPYGFLLPRRVWLFVILVSSISFAGFFLTKFFGEEHSRNLVAVLGGMASTTASTAGFAREYAQNPPMLLEYWHAITLTNTIQFPRILAIVAALFPALIKDVWLGLTAMTAAGCLVSYLLARRSKVSSSQRAMTIDNPLRLWPAMKFGLMFAAVLFLNRWATVEFGQQGAWWGSGIGGLMDADSITVSLAEMFQEGRIGPEIVRGGLLLALVSNGLLKTLLAFWAGGAALGRRTALSFAIMFGAGAAALIAGA